MTKKQSSFPTLLRHLAKAGECLGDDEIAEVVAGRLRLVLSTETTGFKHPTGAPADAPDFSSLISSLESAETREAAQHLIEKADLTRRQLAQVAKTLHAPFNRGDDMARLREKIVEATVGFRSTSKAIHRNA